MKRALFVFLIVTLAAVLLLWQRERNEALHKTAEGLSFSAGQGLSEEAQTSPTEPSSKERLPLAGEDSLPEVTEGRRGIVLDSVFRVPVVAEVMPDRGRSLISDRESGLFEFANDAPGFASLTLRAKGYEARRFDAPSWDAESPAEFLLRPLEQAGVLVTYPNGEAAAECTVVWRAAHEKPELLTHKRILDSRAFTASAVFENRTDEEGRATCAVGERMLVEIREPQGRFSKFVRVHPREVRRVVLARDSITVKFVDDETREPIAGLGVDAWCSVELDAMAIPLTTDANGDITLEASSAPVLLRLTGPDGAFEDLIPLSPGLESAGFGRRPDCIRILAEDSGLSCSFSGS